MSNYSVKRTLMGQFPHGADLYESLTALVQRENIRIGRIQGIGATTHAVIAYYDQNDREYKRLEFDGGMEILHCSGNISIRDGKPFVHAHIILGDRQGKTVGGHLLPGTKLWAFEVSIDELEGEQLIREEDKKTGLFLWNSGTFA